MNSFFLRGLAGLAIVFTLASCANPLTASKPSGGVAAVGGRHAAQVTWDPARSATRSLGTNDLVGSVDIVVRNDSGAVIGSGGLGLVGGTWKGDLEVSTVGPAVFTAYVRKNSGNLLFEGATPVTLVGDDRVVVSVGPLGAVTYDPNGGTGGIEPSDATAYEAGATVKTLGAGTLVRDGYQFAGWTTNNGGAGSSFEAGTEFTKGSENVVLYAVWIPNGLKFSTWRSTISVTGHTGTVSGKLSIPVGVTDVGPAAFYYCTGLTQVVFPESLRSIGQMAFIGSGLRALVLPDSLETLGPLAFQYTDLQNVTIPRAVSSIGVGPFALCPLLQTIAVAADNPNFQSIDGVLFDHNVSTLIEAGAASSLGTYTVPGTVTKVVDWAFAGCSGLTSIAMPDAITDLGAAMFLASESLVAVTLPAQLETIGPSAFLGCRLLEGVAIPAKVTSIGESAFGWCPRLTSLTVDPTNTAFQSVAGGLLSADGKVLYQVAGGLEGTYQVPDGVETIGDRAFSKCKRVTGALLPASLRTIGFYAFEDCGLTSITIPGSVGTIRSYTFQGCSDLARVSFPDSLTTIGIQAFVSCGLTTVTLPAGLTSLGREAFSYCPLLSVVTSPAVLPPTLASGSRAFDSCASELRILVPADSLGAYQGADGWKDYLGRLAADS